MSHVSGDMLNKVIATPELREKMLALLYAERENRKMELERFAANQKRRMGQPGHDQNATGSRLDVQYHRQGYSELPPDGEEVVWHGNFSNDLSLFTSSLPVLSARGLRDHHSELPDVRYTPKEHLARLLQEAEKSTSFMPRGTPAPKTQASHVHAALKFDERAEPGSVGRARAPVSSALVSSAPVSSAPVSSALLSSTLEEQSEQGHAGDRSNSFAATSQLSGGESFKELMAKGYTLTPRRGHYMPREYGTGASEGGRGGDGVLGDVETRHTGDLMGLLHKVSRRFAAEDAERAIQKVADAVQRQGAADSPAGAGIVSSHFATDEAPRPGGTLMVPFSDFSESAHGVPRLPLCPIPEPPDGEQALALAQGEGEEGEVAPAEHAVWDFEVDKSQVVGFDVQGDDVQRDDVQRDDVQRDDVQRDDVQRDDVQRDDVQRDDVQRDDVQRDDVQRDDVQRDDPLGGGGVEGAMGERGGGGGQEGHVSMQQSGMGGSVRGEESKVREIREVTTRQGEDHEGLGADDSEFERARQEVLEEERRKGHERLTPRGSSGGDRGAQRRGSRGSSAEEDRAKKDRKKMRKKARKGDTSTSESEGESSEESSEEDRPAKSKASKSSKSSRRKASSKKAARRHRTSESSDDTSSSPEVVKKKKHAKRHAKKRRDAEEEEEEEQGQVSEEFLEKMRQVEREQQRSEELWRRACELDKGSSSLATPLVEQRASALFDQQASALFAGHEEIRDLSRKDVQSPAALGVEGQEQYKEQSLIRSVAAMAQMFDVWQMSAIVRHGSGQDTGGDVQGENLKRTAELGEIAALGRMFDEIARHSDARKSAAGEFQQEVHDRFPTVQSPTQNPFPSDMSCILPSPTGVTTAIPKLRLGALLPADAADDAPLHGNGQSVEEGASDPRYGSSEQAPVASDPKHGSHHTVQPPQKLTDAITGAGASPAMPLSEKEGHEVSSAGGDVEGTHSAGLGKTSASTTKIDEQKLGPAESPISQRRGLFAVSLYAGAVQSAHAVADMLGLEVNNNPPDDSPTVHASHGQTVFPPVAWPLNFGGHPSALAGEFEAFRIEAAPEADQSPREKRVKEAYSPQSKSGRLLSSNMGLQSSATNDSKSPQKGSPSLVEAQRANAAGMHREITEHKEEALQQMKLSKEEHKLAEQKPLREREEQQRQLDLQENQYQEQKLAKVNLEQVISRQMGESKEKELEDELRKMDFEFEEKRIRWDREELQREQSEKTGAIGRQQYEQQALESLMKQQRQPHATGGLRLADKRLDLDAWKDLNSDEEQLLHQQNERERLDQERLDRHQRIAELAKEQRQATSRQAVPLAGHLVVPDHLRVFRVGTTTHRQNEANADNLRGPIIYADNLRGPTVLLTREASPECTTMKNMPVSDLSAGRLALMLGEDSGHESGHPSLWAPTLTAGQARPTLTAGQAPALAAGQERPAGSDGPHASGKRRVSPEAIPYGQGQALPDSDASREKDGAGIRSGVPPGLLMFGDNTHMQLYAGMQYHLMCCVYTQPPEDDPLTTPASKHFAAALRACEKEYLWGHLDQIVNSLTFVQALCSPKDVQTSLAQLIRFLRLARHQMELVEYKSGMLQRTLDYMSQTQSDIVHEPSMEMLIADMITTGHWNVGFGGSAIPAEYFSGGTFQEYSDAMEVSRELAKNRLFQDVGITDRSLTGKWGLHAALEFAQRPYEQWRHTKIIIDRPRGGRTGAEVDAEYHPVVLAQQEASPKGVQYVAGSYHRGSNVMQGELRRSTEMGTVGVQSRVTADAVTSPSERLGTALTALYGDGGKSSISRYGIKHPEHAQRSEEYSPPHQPWQDAAVSSPPRQQPGLVSMPASLSPGSRSGSLSVTNHRRADGLSPGVEDTGRQRILDFSPGNDDLHFQRANLSKGALYLDECGKTVVNMREWGKEALGVASQNPSLHPQMIRYEI